MSTLKVLAKLGQLSGRVVKAPVELGFLWGLLFGGFTQKLGPLMTAQQTVPVLKLVGDLNDDMVVSLWVASRVSCHRS